MSNATYHVHDPRFRALFIDHAKLEKLWTGGRWLEGPAYFPAARYLVFSDIPNDRMLRFDETSNAVSVLRQPARNTNGHTRDLTGRLVSCEHRGRCVSRTGYDGAVEILVSEFGGKRLNSPNDVVVKSDGTIWFTDPTYGIDSDYEGDAALSEIGASYVYRFDPVAHTLDTVITDLAKPNGLAFSPDEQTLYVADTGATHISGHPRAITSYRVDRSGKRVARVGVFAVCPAGLFDGLRCDAHGNVWASSGEGVQCYAPEGAHIGTIPVPEMVSNLCFGGAKSNRLYITAQTSLYAIFLATRGAGWPAAAG